MKIQDYLQKIFTFSGLTPEEVEIEKTESDDKIQVSVTLPSQKTEAFIGSRGRTIRAIQHLVRLVFRDEIGEKRLSLDINNFREQKEDQLVAEAKSLAREVQRSGREIGMNYLNSYERYLIHSALAEDEELADITSESHGYGSQRQLIIMPKGVSKNRE